MEKRVVFRSAWLPYVAGRAADRDHDRLLLLAGGAGGLLLVPAAGRVRPARRVRRAPELPRALQRQPLPRLVQDHRDLQRRSSPSSASSSRCCSRRWPTASCAARSPTRRCSSGRTRWRPRSPGVLWAFLFAPSIGIVTYLPEARRHRLELDHPRRPGDAADRDRRRSGSRSATTSSSSSPACSRFRTR